MKSLIEDRNAHIIIIIIIMDENTELNFAGL